ncbi:MAG: endonuclease/exonuclease/phosphatase family protein [Balneolaceae bacterium]|nr:endonuclease/exonuclease/phosphatase family protein [Balneolaceae bacterium]
MRVVHFSLIFVLSTALFSCAEVEQSTNNASDTTSADRYEQATTLPNWYNPQAYDTIRVATWNVQHFVDSYNNPYIENEREDLPPPQMSKRRELLAAAIEQLDADIVVLQEFESDSYLQRMAENYFPEMGSRFLPRLKAPTGT